VPLPGSQAGARFLGYAGMVPSKWYSVYSPFAFALIWLAIFVVPLF